MSLKEVPPLTIQDIPRAVSHDRPFHDLNDPRGALRHQAYENQDPFAVLTQLDPEKPWQLEASRWEERAFEKLHSGSVLEVRFHDRYLHSLMGSTALALWQQRKNPETDSERIRMNRDAGLALLTENMAMRHPDGIHRLYIPGERVSHLRTRTFDVRQRTIGEPVTTRYHIVDMQIKTAVDKPVMVFSPRTQTDGTKLKPVDSVGQWFSFPLPEVQLALI